MSEIDIRLDQVLEKLVHDIEAAVHAMYRGTIRQQTAKLKTDAERAVARQALLGLMGNSAAVKGGNTDASTFPTASLSSDEVAAITRCITGWLPMGAPNAATPNSRCISGARELVPTWGEREKARLAVRRASG
jgi:hypothetical protein